MRQILFGVMVAGPACVVAAQETEAIRARTPEVAAIAKELSPPKLPRVRCGVDRLEIEADDSTVSSILSLIGACLAVPMQLPASFADERTYMKAGPGPATDVLNTLLNSTTLNFIIQVSSSNPGKVMSVLLTDPAKEMVDGKETALPENLMMTPARRTWLADREAAKHTAAESSGTAESVVETGTVQVAPPADSAGATADLAPAPQAAADGSNVAAAPVEAVQPATGPAAKADEAESVLRTQINKMQQMFEERRRLNVPATAKSNQQ